MGRTLIGFNQLTTHYVSAELKRKGTNEIIYIDWERETNNTNSDSKYNGFCFNPSITLGYRIHNNIALGIDVNYWLSKFDFDYAETTTNAITHDVQTQKFNYSKLLKEISFSLGFMITF